jgi:hypothetical protein
LSLERILRGAACLSRLSAFWSHLSQHYWGVAKIPTGNCGVAEDFREREKDLWGYKYKNSRVQNWHPEMGLRSDDQ